MDNNNLENVFFYSAKTQHENLGDAVINRELLNLLSLYGKVVVYEGGMPKSFLITIGALSYTTIKNKFKFIIALFFASIAQNKRVYFVLNPGGFSGGCNFFSFMKGLLLISIYALLNVIGVRIIRLGASIGPFTPRRLFLEKIKNRLMYKNTARDPVSLAYAQENGIFDVDYFPDFAFKLPFPEILKNKLSAKNTKYFGFSFRFENINYDTKLKKKLISIAKSAPDKHFFFTSQVDFDVEYNKSLVDFFIENGFSAEYIECNEELSLMKFYQQADEIFSNRLHVLLFSLRHGTLSIPIVSEEKNKKIIGIYQDIGLDRLVLLLENDAPQLSSDNETLDIDNIFKTKSTQIRLLADKLFSIEV